VTQYPDQHAELNCNFQNTVGMQTVPILKRTEKEILIASHLLTIFVTLFKYSIQNDDPQLLSLCNSKVQ
jgi:hypothetical protein